MMEFSVSSLSKSFTYSPAAQVTTYEPTEFIEAGEYRSLYCNICAQHEYHKFSPEELRLSHYHWQKSEETVKCDEDEKNEPPPSPPSKPRVRLPPIIAGVVNAAAVSTLQDELEQLTLKVSLLERALGEQGERKCHHELESQVTRLEWELEKERAASVKLKEEMEATLLRRSEKMKAEINRRLIEEKEALKADALQSLSELQIRELLETNPTFKTVFEDRLRQRIANLPDAQIRELLTTNPTVKAILANNLKKKLEVETTRLKSEHGIVSRAALERAEAEKKAAVLMERTSNVSSLSDAQVRELLSTNPTIKAIVADNLKKKVEFEAARLGRGHEAAMRTSWRNAETEKAQAVLMEGKKSSVKITLAENRSRVADQKLKAVEEATTATPDMPVKTVWEKVRCLKVTASGHDSSTINKSTIDHRSPLAVPSSSMPLPNRQIQITKTVSSIRISPTTPQTNVSRLGVSAASTDVARSHEVRRQSTGHNPAGGLQRSSMNSPAPTHPFGNRTPNPAGVKRTRDAGDIGRKGEQPKKARSDVKK